MKKVVYGWALLTLMSATCLQSCKKETKDERIKRETAEFTEKNCPSKVDEYTTMDSAVYDMQTHKLTYHYTMKGELDNDSIYTEEVLSTFREKVLNEIKTSIQMKNYKDAGLSFAYQYISDKSGKILVSLEITKEEYGGK